MKNDMIEDVNVIHIHDEESISGALISLKENLYEKAINNDEVLKGLAKKYYLYGNVFIMYINGAPKGLCAFYSNDIVTKTAYLSIIVVAQDIQNMGSGSALIEKMVDFCKQQGMIKVRLEVSDSNDKAIKFYKKHGFSMERHLETSSYFIRTIGARAASRDLKGIK